MVEPESNQALNRELAAPAAEMSSLEQPTRPITTPTEAIKQAEKSLKDIYFISGLGADERVFRLLKFEGYRPVHIHWLEPKHREPIADYAKRLAVQIQSNSPIVIGLSFGGMIAVEIAKQIEVEKVILISSVKDKFEVPFYFRLFRWFQIHRILPYKNLRWLGYIIACWLFGLESLAERTLMKAILLDTDIRFMKWALHQLITWDNETVPDHLYQIHGTSDRVFPICFVQPNFVLERGGHFMIMNRANQISALLEKIMA
ncbi:MAG: alpha/beta hydrolase [Cyanobacteria bacterium RM1_2_2]|nr:alpha/beta hydrolase [Cyanobacteria bacterium RM1_2_2]